MICPAPSSQDFDIQLLEEYALNDEEMEEIFDGANFSDASKDTTSVNTEVRGRRRIIR